MEFTIELRAELTAQEFAGMLGALEARDADRNAKAAIAEETKAMVRRKLDEMMEKAEVAWRAAAAEAEAERQARGATPDGPAFEDEPEGDPDDEYLRAKAADDLERRLAAEDPEDPEEPEGDDIGE